MDDKINWEPKPNEVVSPSGSTTDLADDLVIDATSVERVR